MYSTNILETGRKIILGLGFIYVTSFGISYIFIYNIIS